MPSLILICNCHGRGRIVLFGIQQEEPNNKVRQERQLSSQFSIQGGAGGCIHMPGKTYLAH
eukprot:2433867-Ditylum_brightwellii.AAC.1